MAPLVNQRATMHRQGWKRMQQKAQATEGLYRVLTPRQQAKARTLLRFHPGSGMFREGD
jgi:Spy/CpxP family protein refolding chaperone